MSTLGAALQDRVTRHPDRLAILEGDRRITYGELGAAIHAVQDRLSGVGVGAGDRVGVVLANGSAFATAFFAIAGLGAVAVPMNPSYKPAEISAIVDEARPYVIVAAEPHEATCRAAAAAATISSPPSLLLIGADGWVAATQTPSRRAGTTSLVRPTDPLLFLYSSGTTGRPKRIERSHRQLLFEIGRLRSAIALSESDRVLGVAPFSHINGLVRSLAASLLAGATLIPVPQFERRVAGRIIDEHRVTVFIGVPFMFAMLAETRWPTPVDFSSLRVCVSASAPLRRDTYERFRERYGKSVRQLYGTSETGSIAINLDPDVDGSFESVGTPLEGIDVQIFSEERRPLPLGEEGEIGIQSPAATTEYPGLPDQSSKAFSGGYFFPGDIGRKDESGRIYLLGRKSLFINRGGYKVNPYEVEDLLEKHPNVQEAVVVGIDTDLGDQKVKAVIVLSAPCQEGDIIEFCRGRISEFKIPSIVEFRTEMPKSAAGKVLRSSL